jgi:hypothetical protein
MSATESFALGGTKLDRFAVLEGRSRACQIASRIVQGDATARRIRTLAHACCEGAPCACPCHRGEVSLYGQGDDPLPVVDQA